MQAVKATATKLAAIVRPTAETIPFFPICIPSGYAPLADRSNLAPQALSPARRTPSVMDQLGDSIMAIPLYDVSVLSFLQTVGAVAGVLEKGLAHCKAAGIDPETIVDTRLAPDMLPFRFQIVSVAHHSAGALDSVRSGQAGPPTMDPGLDYAGLQALVADALAKLKAAGAEEVNGWEGKDVVFALGEMKMPFTAEGFLMSFSIPNLHFHAATTYDILRQAGAPLGKRDYMGRPRLKM